MSKPATEWDGAAVLTWLASRIVAARADQVAAEKRGQEGRGDCDAAAAEEMVCTLLRGGGSADAQGAFLDALRALLDRDDYVWRGVYEDRRFDRHVRGYVRKLAKMAKANYGLANAGRFQ